VTEANGKTKIVILGGGTGSIVAAFYLTNTPELRQKYDLTLYQLGWRIGGKGASGRDLNRQRRNLEHGLHTWFGFYINAFTAMKACYDELNRSPGAPLATIEDAFKQTSDFIFHENYQGRWVDWPITFPTNKSKPWDDTLLPSFWEMVDEFAKWAWEVLRNLLSEKQEFFLDVSDGDDWEAPEFWDELVEELEADLGEFGHIVETRLLELARHLTGARRHEPEKFTSEAHYSYLCRLLNEFKSWLWERVVEPHLDDDKIRAYFITMDTGSAIVCGIVQDDLLNKGFASIDDWEFSDWLKARGAREEPSIKEGPWVKAGYDMVFGYEDGDIGKRNFAAGTAVNAILRLVFTYKGSVYWKMQAGMGDTVFAPFYEVLKRRGVHFKFFHAVTNLGFSGEEITSIDVVPQVQLTVDEYNPLVPVKGLPCWPSEPFWDQLENGQALRQQGVNFEYQVNPLNAEPVTLAKGQDFDLVVLGISIAGLPAICGDIIDQSDKWQAMIANVKTVMTQAFQLWINRDEVQGLGWRYNPGAMAVTYVEPLSTIWSENQLVERENWPAEFDLQTIAYCCGVMQDVPNESQKKATERAKAQALEFLKNNVRHLWPRSTQTPESPVLNWQVLIDPQERQGEARFDAQYWRANLQPSERYVISAAGSTKHRLRTDESGFQNLFLAGDWIKIGFDAGCIEAATMSGMQAARAISGQPLKIVGEKDSWL
jgi:uncharacterized protein with NAD-binding domain and iron-sulfur cluster